jgi:prolyl 4-hydroxylase
MSPPGRQQPEAAVLRQAPDRPQDGPTSSLSPKGSYRSAPHEGIPVNGESALAKLPADWQGWLRENVGRGCSAGSMHPLVVAAGFEPGLVARAIDEARQSHAIESLRQAPVRPEPDTTHHRRLADGREVRVAMRLAKPRIVLFESLLDAAECEALAAQAAGKLATSTVVDDADGVPRPHAHRTSAGAWFERGQTPLVAAVERRIEDLLQWPASHGEGLQVLRYEAGGEYRAHFDYFDPAKPGSAPHLAQAGQRVATLIIYLADAAEGGGTMFPTLGLEFRPRAGSALFFSNVDEHGDIDPATLHAGQPVISGVKLIATKWLRAQVFGAAA